jgi:hypothetical protein
MLKMNRSIVLALSAAAILGACSDHKPTNMAAVSTPELLPAQPAPPAVEVPAVPLPPLPAVNASDPDAAPVPSAPTPVETVAAPLAIDSPETDPKGALTKAEEAVSMPMAGHGNNHSSPALGSSSSSDSLPQK